ncbi:uncharacterized protein LOC142984967 [Anticarsia gemmatalis]|uniref:uncharacterized protein LOC142984967 n=1 Tax=Anticarsia gemmatalis TaxID=129554 RepID=UPI003F765DAF
MQQQTAKLNTRDDKECLQESQMSTLFYYKFKERKPFGRKTWFESANAEMSGEVPVTIKREKNESKTRKKKAKVIAVKDGTEKPNPKLVRWKKNEKHLINIKEILRHTNATPIRRYRGLGYNCCYCEEQFPEANTLKKHTTDTHKDLTKAEFMGVKFADYAVKLDITNLICKICNSPIDTLEQVMQHLKQEHKKNIYMDIPNHIIPFKFDTEVLRCYMCSNVFNKFKALLEHMHVHYRNYICDVCDAGFINNHGITNHKMAHKLGSFQCQFCPKVFKTTRTKNSHERTVHIHAHYIYKCPYCNEKFYNIKYKYSHMEEKHGTKPTVYKCNACDKIFNNANHFRSHTRRDHLLERRFKCLECDKAFFTKKSLSSHEVTHSGTREFQCDVCLKCYGRKKTLREHMRIHNDEKRFKCEHCGQAFVQKCSMKAHLKSKHGDPGF